jgi:hypothetical protein
LRRIHPSIQCAAYVSAHSIACARHWRSAPAAASRQPLSRTSREAAAAQPAALLSRGLAASQWPQRVAHRAAVNSTRSEA